MGRCCREMEEGRKGRMGCRANDMIGCGAWVGAGGKWGSCGGGLE